MPVKIFCCYARKDQLLLNELKTHLNSLERQELITVWADTNINAGEEWEKEIEKHLTTAQIILLLISPDFIASEYCYSKEMQQALEQHKRGEAHVIPIILRPTHWQEGPLEKLQALPTGARPITDPTWHDVDRALYNVIEGIRSIISTIQTHQNVDKLPLRDIPACESPGGNLCNQSEKHPAGALLHILRYHAGAVYSIEWSPDGQYLASAGADKSIFIKAYSTHREVQFPREHSKAILALTWSPDSSRLASGGNDGHIHLWDIASQTKYFTYRGHCPRQDLTKFLLPLEVFSLAWSPNGRFIASGGEGGTTRVWNAQTGEDCYLYNGHAFGRDDEGHYHPACIVSSLVWSPDGKRLAATRLDSSEKYERDMKFISHIPLLNRILPSRFEAHLWDALTGNNVLSYSDHVKGITSLAWSPDGKLLASASKDMTVHIWNPAVLQTLRRITQGFIYRGHTHQVKAVVWSPDNAYVASAGSDHTVRVWNPVTGEHIHIYQEHKKQINALAWSPDGSVIASADNDGIIHIWKAPQKLQNG